MARYQNKASDLGAFIDSVADRCVDMALLAGIVWLYLSDDKLLLGGVSLIALLAASLTSYVKARAEGLSAKPDASGIMQRPERVIALIFGLAIPGALEIAIIVIAVLGVVTTIQRTVHYLRELR